MNRQLHVRIILVVGTAKGQRSDFHRLHGMHIFSLLLSY
jgi:hypothetical protein